MILFTFVMAGGMNFLMYWTSSFIVQRTFGATVNGAQASELYDMTGRMVARLRQEAAFPITMNVSPGATTLAKANPLAAHPRVIAKLSCSHPPAGVRVAALAAVPAQSFGLA